eukprot:645569-Rhodomonas_salina.2
MTAGPDHAQAIREASLGAHARRRRPGAPAAPELPTPRNQIQENTISLRCVVVIALRRPMIMMSDTRLGDVTRLCTDTLCSHGGMV